MGGVQEESREVWEPQWYGGQRSSRLGWRENGDFGIGSERFSRAALLHWHGQVQDHTV